MAIDVVDLFQVVHIKEYQTSIMRLHKFCGKTFAQVAHGKTGKEIIAFCIFLLFMVAIMSEMNLLTVSCISGRL